MDNNDILRRARYIFDFNDKKMMKLFRLGGIEASREEISNWLKKEDDLDFDSINDKMLAVFLNGFIISKRGARGDEPPKPESSLSNNLILRKFKIALELKDDDMLEALELTGIYISKHELSAFFRNPKQKQYRLCKDQILRNFLRGLQIKHRGDGDLLA